MTTLTLVILLLSVQQALSFQVPIPRPNNNIAKEFRIPRANKLLQYMDQSVDPCVDFYEFACGNWNRFHEATENKPITSPLKDLQDKVYREVQDLLEERITNYDGNVGRRVKDFYSSCMDGRNASHSVRQVFSDFVKQYGGMPAVDKRWSEHNFDWLEKVSNFRNKFGMDIIIGLEVRADHQNPRDRRITIGEPSMLVPKKLCNASDFNNIEYEELQRKVIDNMAYWFDTSENYAKKMASEMFEFENALCRGMSADEENLDASTSDLRKTLPEFNLQFRRIDFQQFVTNSFGQQIPQPVYMQSENYFKNLGEVIHHTSKRVLANYIMYRALDKIGFPNEQDARKRTRLCIEKCILHFPKVVGEMYHRKIFRLETVEDIEQLWSKIRETFKMDLYSQFWIEENARRQAISKVQSMQLKFPTYSKEALQSEYRELEINKTDFWGNIQRLIELDQKREMRSARGWANDVESSEIKVGFSPVQNIIRMPLGLLQYPVYHRTAPSAYKYGALGFFIARQLVQGLDAELSQTTLYKEQVECFKDQYLNYVDKDAELALSELREIVADNGGLNISFNAYLMWLQKTSDQHTLYEETLSDVNYTNTQLFFITFAQTFCTSTYVEETPVGFFPWDVSNRAEKFRVNGPLSNMKEFSREFNCLPGTDMNPADKCIIY